MGISTRGAALACACVLAGAPAYAAASRSDLSDVKRELRLLEQRRLEDQRRIEQLEHRLGAAETKAQNAEARASAAEAKVQAQGQIQAQAQAQMAAQAQAQPQTAAAEPSAEGGGSGPALPGAFNPAIGVVLDGRWGKTTLKPSNWNIAGQPRDDVGHANRGFSLGESEINAQANVDDWFFGNLTLSFEEQDGNTDVGVEEAFLQTLSMPYGLQVTGGRFFSAIGYLNGQHAHADDFADRPLAYQAFLAEQYDDDGVRLTWLAPAPIFVQFGGEAFRGNSFPAQGSKHGGVGTKSAFLKLGGDVGTDISWVGGLSYLWAAAAHRETGDMPDVFRGTTDVGVAHLVVKWAPDGNPVQHNLKFQTEAFRVHPNGTFNDQRLVRTSYGLYGQIIYQFMPQWRTGYRYDWISSGGVHSALDGSTVGDRGHDPHRHSVMLEYDHSEFSRIRLQYNRDEARASGTDNQVLLQYTLTLGAHGAHSY